MKTIRVTALAVSTFVIPAFAQDLPDGPGKEQTAKACIGCHGAENFTAKRASKDDWKAVVETMIGYGAEIPKDQLETIVNYLAKNFGKQ